MTTINNLTKHDFKIGNWVKANDGQFGFNELFRIEDFFADKDGVLLAVLDDGDCYPLSFLEHASEAEIKAGHRIDDTTDYIIDIRNHVSPSTIVWDLASGEDWTAEVRG